MLCKENEKVLVVMGIKFYAFIDFFSEKPANGFDKGQQNFHHTQNPLWDEKSWD